MSCTSKDSKGIHLNDEFSCGWSNLPQVPQDSVFQQSGQQGGIPARSGQSLAFQPSDQQFLTPQQTQRQGGNPVQNPQASVLQRTRGGILAKNPQASVLQQTRGGILAKNPQDVVFQPSDQKFLAQQGLQLQNQGWGPAQNPQASVLQQTRGGILAKNPQASVLQQTRGILAKNPQDVVFQPSDQKFLAPQGLQLQNQGWGPAQNPQASVLQQTRGGILAKNPQDVVFQPSDQKFLAQQALQQQTAHQFSQAFLPKQPVAQAEPLDKCAVADYEQIQCGPPGISAAECDAINCCFDGQQCYYGKAVTVQCIRDGQFVVVVARDVTLPSLSLDTVRLLGGNDPPCAPVGSTPSFAIYQFPVTACGTSMMEDNGYVVYENRMTSSYEVGIGPLGSITRDSHFELLFQCRYSGTAVQALVVEVNTVPPPPPVAAPGPLRVELRLANGQCVTKGCAEEDAAYTSYYSDADYPVTKVLRQPVYVEVHLLERTDPNIVLMLGHCWATSSPDSLSLPQWDLLVNGCPYQDDRYLTTPVPVDGSTGLQFPTHYKRFIVKMFTFVDPASLAPLQGMVFIHCSTSVCHPSSTGSCEQSCTRQKRDVGENIEKTVVSSGGIFFM
ncbi:zona pellucida sperm-binding protein 4-like [Xyrauchen texanus]|uniref:zona pellucida sperm-binding protein 4-like n=1 Tax=Xyrauchen texanus TaxID=154827 RepID=UPI002241ACE2|nr:zona pellucida sperm-binding protein 4-like [Xyrauchen texanus]